MTLGHILFGHASMYNIDKNTMFSKQIRLNLVPEPLTIEAPVRVSNISNLVDI